jgi:hypothetical protein
MNKWLIRGWDKKDIEIPSSTWQLSTNSRDFYWDEADEKLEEAMLRLWQSVSDEFGKILEAWWWWEHHPWSWILLPEDFDSFKNPIKEIN